MRSHCSSGSRIIRHLYRIDRSRLIATHGIVFGNDRFRRLRLRPSDGDSGSAPPQLYSSIALYRAACAGGTEFGAQFIRTVTALCPNVDPRPTHAAACEPMVQDAGLPAAQDARVLLLQPTIRGERHLIR